MSPWLQFVFAALTTSVLAVAASADNFPPLLEVGASPDAPPALVHARAPLTDDIRAVARGNNQFALDIYRQLAAAAEAGENLLVSPLSISAALGMTYAGARNQTAQQMAAGLHFTLPDDRFHAVFGDLLADLGAEREGYELNIANRLFGQDGFAFKQPFLDTTSGNYRAPLEQLHFAGDPDESRLHINDWVEEQTNDRIKDLLPSGSVTSFTRLVLTNAIYFDGDWKYKFDKENTSDAAFHLADGGVTQASLMYQRNAFRYGRFDGFQMLELRYAGDDLSMVLMLPDAVDGIAALEESLTDEKLTTNLAAMYEREVDVYFPKFTFSSSFGLSDSMAARGITDLFSPGSADLTGIADAGLFVSDVLHKTFIDVSEEGTEAAAATAVVVGITSALPSPPPVFRADHPFLFALRDNHTGSLMFLGRVMETESIAGAPSVPGIPEPSSGILIMIGAFTFRGRPKRGR
jgi:serpin B